MANGGKSSSSFNSSNKASPPSPSHDDSASPSPHPSSKSNSSADDDSDSQHNSSSKPSKFHDSPSPLPSPSPSPSNSPPPSPSNSPPPSPPPPSSPPPLTPPPSPSPSPEKSPPPKVPPPSPSPPLPRSPPPSQPSPSPPPPAPSTSSPPSPVTPPPPPPPPPSGSVPSRPPAPPQSPPPHSRSSGSTPSRTASRESGRDRTGEYIGFALAGLSIIAFVGLIVFVILKRRKKMKNRGNDYSGPTPKGGDLHYYVENGQREGFYGSGPSHSASGGAYGNMNHPGSLRHMRTLSDPGQHQMSAGPIAFSYEKIMEITDGFSSGNVIGEGGFGCVYKASMPDGRVGAVKMLKAGSGQGEREFRAEVEIISRVHHRHLVSLIGYCISEHQRLLIYEFVPNGNLSQHLHEDGKPVLDWPKRMKIANGAARGLAYLHEGCNPKIIHRDIKSPNILLDNAYEAQVADFGLARLTDDADTHVSTRVMGTFGYMAPEYATSGKLTDRSDVFSFGVVLLELITGRKPVDPTQPVGDESLVEWARPLLLHAIETHELGDLVDPRLEKRYIESEMLVMVETAAACVRHSAPKRPRMVQVARVLDCGDQFDLSNGVKYGQSTIYDSAQYNEDLMRFRRMANGSFSDSDFDLNSKEHISSGPSRMQSSSGGVNNLNNSKQY